MVCYKFTGSFSIDSLSLCELSLLQEPRILIGLQVMNSSTSIFTENDVISIPVDKNKIYCAEGICSIFS